MTQKGPANLNTAIVQKTHGFIFESDIRGTNHYLGNINKLVSMQFQKLPRFLERLPVYIVLHGYIL